MKPNVSAIIQEPSSGDRKLSRVHTLYILKENKKKPSKNTNQNKQEIINKQPIQYKQSQIINKASACSKQYNKLKATQLVK